MSSEEVAAADSLVTENAELRRALAVAMTESDGWRAAAEQLHQRRHEAFVLLGQVDYFLETFLGQPKAAQKQQAARLITKIKQLAGLK